MSESAIAWSLGQHLLITTILAAFVWLICRSARISPTTRHVLWLLVLCRLMVPPIATWPWSIPVDVNPTHESPLVTASNAFRSGVSDNSPSNVISMLDAVPAEIKTSTVNPPTDNSLPVSTGHQYGTTMVSLDDSPATKSTWKQVNWLIVGLWVAGSLTFAAILVVRVRRVGHVLDDTSNAGDWLRADVAKWCNCLTVRAPKCVVTERVRSPFLWCFGRVLLVWPLSESHPEQRQHMRPILVHELAHLKRRDHWVAWVEMLGLVVWWWNPVFWFVRRELKASAEMACDAWVVEMLPEQRRAYAESLVEFSRRGRLSQMTFGAVGANTGCRRIFARRLEMIMNEDSSARFSKWTMLSAVLLGAISLPAFSIEPPKIADEAQDGISVADQKEIAELVAEFNNFLNERRFAEAELVAQQSQKLYPENPLTAVIVEKSRLARLNREIADSDSTVPADSDSPATSQDSTAPTEKRVVVSKIQRVVKSTTDDTTTNAQVNGSASLNEVLIQIERQYYGKIDRRELEQAAIEAIMSRLDDKSSVLSREEIEQLTVLVDGNLVGVGIAIHLDADTGQPVVTRPIRNSPSLEAGLRRNDVILSIDGESTEGLSLKELIDRIRGPRGSTVTLKIQRPDETLDVKVVRKQFEISLVNPWSVSSDGKEDYWADRDAKIGYVHIPSFTRQTASQLRKVLSDLRDSQMNGLVLDLRDCHGGLLTAATAVVDMFIDEGVILSSQSRNTDENTTFRATEGGEFTELPLAVLMNDQTASAAEIVAAALQDHHRSSTVGQQTFGRGTVQSIFRLNDGRALKLTTAAWLRANGRTLLRREGRDDWGVQPDAGLAVTVTNEARMQLAEQRQKRLDGEKSDVPADDPQLRKALASFKLN